MVGMNLYQILVYLQGKSESEATEFLNATGVPKSLHKYILNCYNSRRQFYKGGILDTAPRTKDEEGKQDMMIQNPSDPILPLE